jgi:cyclopropane fatty-acyl-phospholipid synthase-like methyltransferase
MKVYNQFTDKFNNEYKFDNYMEFSRFWFSLSRKVAMSYFPTTFSELQKAAANSKEARAHA